MEAKEDIKDQMKNSRIKSQLTKRKHNINQKIWNSRLLNSSNQNQLQQVDEEQEVNTEKEAYEGLPAITSTKTVITTGEDAKGKSAGSANREAT